MQKSSKSLMVIVMAILVIVIGYFGAYGQWQKMGEARTAFDSSKLANDKLKKAQADASAFLNRYESNRTQAELANRTLPMGSADIPNILSNFSTLIADSGLSLTDMTISDSAESEAPPEPNTVQSVDMDIQATGTYEAFSDLLLRIQRNLRLIDLVSMNISQGQTEGSNGNVLMFSLRFRTYYQQ